MAELCKNGCGTALTPARRGRPAKFCSPECRYIWWADNRPPRCRTAIEREQEWDERFGPAGTVHV